MFKRIWNTVKCEDFFGFFRYKCFPRKMVVKFWENFFWKNHHEMCGGKFHTEKSVEKISRNLQKRKMPEIIQDKITRKNLQTKSPRK